MMKPSTHVFIGVIAASVVWAFIYESKQPEAPTSRQSATQPAPKPCPTPGSLRDPSNPDEFAAYQRCEKRCTDAYNKCIAKMCSERAAYYVPTTGKDWVRTKDENANCVMACMYTNSECSRPCSIRGVD